MLFTNKRRHEQLQINKELLMTTNPNSSDYKITFEIRMIILTLLLVNVSLFYFLISLSK